MTRDKLNDEYFDWLCDFVCSRPDFRISVYDKLLAKLHDTTFNYIIPMDENRFNDGVELRYRFGRENSCPQSLVAIYLDDRPCSVLEMMVALAVRCEDDIMTDPDIGDRTYVWFWDMIRSLGLYFMTDNHFDSELVDEVVERFIRRGYKRNGEGGLFTVRNTTKDMRNLEIWDQMCNYLDNVVSRKG